MTYLVGKDIKLVKFTEKFVVQKYIQWLNDHDVNRYMCGGRIPISKEEVGERNDKNNVIFAIMSSLSYDKDGDQLVEGDFHSEFIGTIGVNGIDWINRKGEIGYMIGEKTHWGAGLATEAVNLISDYALNRLNLHKIEAGVVKGNTGSVKVLEKNGFKEYATVPQDYWLEGEYHDVLRFYRLQEW